MSGCSREDRVLERGVSLRAGASAKGRCSNPRTVPHPPALSAVRRERCRAFSARGASSLPLPSSGQALWLEQPGRTSLPGCFDSPTGERHETSYPTADLIVLPECWMSIEEYVSGIKAGRACVSNGVGTDQWETMPSRFEFARRASTLPLDQWRVLDGAGRWQARQVRR